MAPRTWDVRNGAPPTFGAALFDAPSDGAVLGGNTASFAVSGTGLGNVELVSAKDPTIIYGRFTVSSDKTMATLVWAFRTPPNYGTFDLRILAWDVPPGQAGQQIEVMPRRHYIIDLPLSCSGHYPDCGSQAP
jgi:hypothetical protein